MDTSLRHARRTGDPVAELTALTRMPALRSLPPCRHCGRDLSRVEVACRRWSYSIPCDDPETCNHPQSCPVTKSRCTACNGTGRTEWPWRGDTGRLGLLAYAGDEAARLLVPRKTQAFAPLKSWPSWPIVDALPMDTWLRGLDRWPGALLGAGILAGQAVLRTLEGEPTPGGGVVTAEARLALDAATEHHLCGCEASREAWVQADPLGGLGQLDWLVHPGDPRGDPTWRWRIQAAVREIDEATIRAAICAGLTGWARTGVL